MDAVHDIAPGEGADRIMLVMLPGAQDRPQDFAEQGFIHAIRKRRLRVDAVAVDAHLGYYLQRSVIDRLTTDVIEPARAQGYRRIWLMGISLGGLGSLIYAREHAARIEGVILLAPFLGTRGTIAEVVRAGGLSQWQPGEITPDDDERRILAWLKSYQPDDPTLPKIYLGYGTRDRFAPASMMLAERLPGRRVAIVEGGHDWPTWVNLWNKLLEQDLFLPDSDQCQ
jgi:pimeloyl-ACP methyl ester carboxylesterase